MWVEDFDGRFPRVTGVGTDRLLEIRRRTVATLDTPGLVISQSLWFYQDQLRIIDTELRRRGVAP